MLDLIKNPTFWTTTALLAPLAVNLDPADFEELQTTRNRSGESSTTTITVGGGAGTHGTGVEVLLGTITGGGYGCDGSGPSSREITTTLDFEEDFVDAGGELDFKPAGKPLHIGVRGGYIWERATFVGEPPVNPLNDEVVEVPPGVELTNQYGYVNPYFAIESETFGFGLGVIVSDQPLRTGKVREFPLDKNRTTQPSFHVRFGNLDRIYFNYSLWENVPVYSGGGAHNVGLGLQLGKLVGVWGGLSSGGPFRTDAALFRATVGSFSPGAVNVTARVPMEYKGHDGVTLIEETSFGMSLRFRFGGSQRE